MGGTGTLASAGRVWGPGIPRRGAGPEEGLRKEGCKEASEVRRPKRREEEEDQIGSLG